MIQRFFVLNLDSRCFYENCTNIKEYYKFIYMVQTNN